MGVALSSLSRSNISSKGSKQGKRIRQTRLKGVKVLKHNDVKYYLPLYKATLEGEWEDARPYFDEDPGAVAVDISGSSETTLHIAVGTAKSFDFLERLVERMSPEDLELTDRNGETALSVAATVGNIKAARLLVNKNPNLPNVADNSIFPIHRAAQYGHREMVSYLLHVAGNIEPSPCLGEPGVKLLNSIISAGLYDIGYDLVEKYPELVTMEQIGVGSPLEVLAEMANDFPSGSSNPSFWGYFLNPCAHWKHIQATKKRHDSALKLVKFLCEEIAQSNYDEVFSRFQQPLHLAAKFGIHEIIEEIIKVFPRAIWLCDEKKYNVFQLAVIYRRENVFNLIYQMSDYKHLVTRYIDPKGNNILHLAGELPPHDRLSLVSGAALQMQRELQWFEEVGKFVQPAYKTLKNSSGKTPSVVFSETHENLLKGGEKWMKETTTSCTVVAALVATVVFAAAITLPGGNQDNGIPIFINNSLPQYPGFIIFGVFDAISLFSSVASIVVFLSILTSRYSEGDFLKALPKRLIIGLSCLFISIASLMVAFTATLYLIFGQQKLWRLFIICALAVLPILLFAFLQFPLLVDIARATYGGGIFGRRGNRVLH